MTEKKKLNHLIEGKANGQKFFALLIDPDKVHDRASLQRLINVAIENEVDFFLWGKSHRFRFSKQLHFRYQICHRYSHHSISW